MFVCVFVDKNIKLIVEEKIVKARRRSSIVSVGVSIFFLKPSDAADLLRCYCVCVHGKLEKFLIKINHSLWEGRAHLLGLDNTNHVIIAAAACH